MQKLFSTASNNQVMFLNPTVDIQFQHQRLNLRGFLHCDISTHTSVLRICTNRAYFSIVHIPYYCHRYLPWTNPRHKKQKC